MDSKEYVAAVDLGTTKVVMAIGRKFEKNKVEILAVKELVSTGVMKGDLKNGEQAARVIRDVKARVEADMGITIKEIVVGISGQHIKCIPATGYVFVQNSDKDVSEVTESDVKRLKDDMRNTSLPLGQTIITVLPQAYTLDEEMDILDPVGMEGRRLEAKFNLIIGEVAAIDRIRRCFSRVGLNLSNVMLQPLASAEAVLSEDEKELGVVVVDIGGGTTDMCIYYDKVIRHVAVIPIGGNIINKDIKAYGILERHVEKLKVNFGEAIPEKAPAEKYINIPSVSGQAPKEIAIKALSSIIEARMLDIIDYVNMEVEKCGYKGKLGAGIVLTGGGSTLKNLVQLFKQNTGMEVRLATPGLNLIPESAELLSNPKYSTVTGLIIDSIRGGRFTSVELGMASVENVAEDLAPVSDTRRVNTLYSPVNQPLVQTAQDVVAPSQQTKSEQLADRGIAATQMQSSDVVDEQQESDEELYNEHNQREYDSDADNYDQEVDDFGEHTEYDYSQEQITTTTKHKRKSGIVDKLKGIFGGMFEEVDDDDNF